MWRPQYWPFYLFKNILKHWVQAWLGFEPIPAITNEWISSSPCFFGFFLLIFLTFFFPALISSFTFCHYFLPPSTWPSIHMTFALLTVFCLTSFHISCCKGCNIKRWWENGLLAVVILAVSMQPGNSITRDRDELNWVKWLIIIIINGGILSPDRFPPLSSRTKTHHGGNLSWWEYAGRPFWSLFVACIMSNIRGLIKYQRQ